ncbi:MAG: hypothetical protein MUF49_32390, partial [Oculatellaceae cyanobacterium Prado106]|nr:hypothetical protein [Oculatellaceae cyanobacterium Prado106]
HPEMTEAEAFEAAIAVAHEEDVTRWVGAIAQVLEEGSGEQTLLGLQERLEIPLVEVWLGVLLGGYGLMQRGGFYQRETLWVEGVK